MPSTAVDVTITEEELKKFSGKDFGELTSSLTGGQRDYIWLRLRGFGVGESLKTLGYSAELAPVWRSQSSYFKKVEKYILDRPEAFINASTALMTTKMAKVDWGLITLASKISEWSTIDKGDKPYIFKAVELVQRLRLHAKDGGEKRSKGFDEKMIEFHGGK